MEIEEKALALTQQVQGYKKHKKEFEKLTNIPLDYVTAVNPISTVPAKMRPDMINEMSATVARKIAGEL